MLFTMITAASGCLYQGKRVSGDGRVTTETRSVGDFRRLVVDGDMQVILSQGPLSAARITAESNIQPYITLTNQGDELTVGFRDYVSVAATQKIRVYLRVPDPEALTLTGSGEISGADTLASTRKIALKLTGSGDIDVKLHAPEVSCDITGSGDVLAAGDTRDLAVKIIGSGDYRGAGLRAESAQVKIAGSGNATLFASIGLHASVLGSGNVYYLGDPAVETSLKGSGKVMKKTN